MDVKVLLGKRIREYRQKLNLKQSQFAEMLGIDDKHLSRIELGKNMPTAVLLSKLAEVLNIEIKDLFEFSHLDNQEEILEKVRNITENLSKEQLVLTYKYVRTFVI